MEFYDCHVGWGIQVQGSPPEGSPGYVPGTFYAQQCPVEKPGGPPCCPQTRGGSHTVKNEFFKKMLR